MRPTGISTRNPAAARSSSDSPPQNPYSRCSRAQLRHGRITGQEWQIALALASRTSRASGRSPGGAKKTAVLPQHTASAIQAVPPGRTGAVANMVMANSLQVGPSKRQRGSGAQVGGTGAPDPSSLPGIQSRLTNQKKS